MMDVEQNHIEQDTEPTASETPSGWGMSISEVRVRRLREEAALYPKASHPPGYAVDDLGNLKKIEAPKTRAQVGKYGASQKAGDRAA